MLMVLAVAGCRAQESAAPPAESGAVGPTVPGPDKAAPRWEHVSTFTGSGDERTEGFEIGAGAIQWRVTVRCSLGTIRVGLGGVGLDGVELDGVGPGGVGVGLDGETSALAELADCPASAFGFSIRTGPATLDVAATGDWEVIVDQQVDTPVAESALAGMTDAARLAHGDFYGIDQEGSGTATLFRLPGGDRALRFDPFLVTRNSDLFVWVSEARAPRTSEEALRTPHVQIDRLRSTSGAQNYLLPDSIDLDQVRSVVVWCEPVRTAYAAATLVP